MRMSPYLRTGQANYRKLHLWSIHCRRICASSVRRMGRKEERGGRKKKKKSPYSFVCFPTHRPHPPFSYTLPSSHRLLSFLSSTKTNQFGRATNRSNVGSWMPCSSLVEMWRRFHALFYCPSLAFHFLLFEKQRAKKSGSIPLSLPT